MKLKRILSTMDGTVGVLISDTLPVLYTLELPYKNNEPYKSCIPTGRYRMNNIVSPALGYVVGLSQVKNRSAILIHAGNTIADTAGCILVGRKALLTCSAYELQSSAEALQMLRAALPLLPNTANELIIEEQY